MALFDVLEGMAENIGAKAGLSADQVRSLSATLQAKMGDGSTQIEAIEATASEHGIPVDKIQEVLAHAGDQGGLMDKLRGMTGGLFKS